MRADDAMRRLRVEEAAVLVANSPDHLEVVVTGAQNLSALQSEVGLKCQILLVSEARIDSSATTHWRLHSGEFSSVS